MEKLKNFIKCFYDDFKEEISFVSTVFGVLLFIFTITLIDNMSEPITTSALSNYDMVFHILH